jgi:hypothetical protein
VEVEWRNADGCSLLLQFLNIGSKWLHVAVLLLMIDVFVAFSAWQFCPEGPGLVAHLVTHENPKDVEIKTTWPVQNAQRVTKLHTACRVPPFLNVPAFSCLASVLCVFHLSANADRKNTRVASVFGVSG